MNSNDFSAGFRTEYNNRNINIRLSGVFVADDFRSDLGFVRRTDILKINPKLELKQCVILMMDLKYQK